MFCVIILYVLKLAGQASLTFGKVFCVNDTALPLLHTLTKRHHYFSCRFFRWQIPASFPKWLRQLFMDEIWLGLYLRNQNLRNIDLVLWQNSHICATKRFGIHSSDPDHHDSYNMSRTHPGHISMPVKSKKGNCESLQKSNLTKSHLWESESEWDLYIMYIYSIYLNKVTLAI